MEIQPIVIGTAGHIDHGKSTLVQALTGTDPDRWAEEKERGMTIDLGFARMELPDGRVVGLVDVPGHERFVRNMVAGASGIDLVILVVAADDGVMPQTREHLAIMDLLGVQRGFVALTKVDMVDEEMVELAEEEVRESVLGTFLEGAPILRVSAVAGTGMDALKSLLMEMAAAIEARPAEGVFRMPVQRVFSVRGFGTVLTGIPVAGTVAVGDSVEVLPSGQKGTVRGIQAYHEKAGEARAGHSAALNLRDVEHGRVGRGDVVATPGFFQSLSMVGARVRALPGLDIPITNRMQVRVHTGTADALGELVLLDSERLEGGEEGLVQFRMTEPLVCAPGDRFVVRLATPVMTLGGGVILEESRYRLKRFKTFVLDELSRQAASLGSLRARLESELARAPERWMDTGALAVVVKTARGEVEAVLESLRGEGLASTVGPASRWMHTHTLDLCLAQVSDAMDQWFAENPMRTKMDVRELRSSSGLETGLLGALLKLLEERGDLSCESGGMVVPQGREVQIDESTQSACTTLMTVLGEGGFQPPHREELEQRLGLGTEPMQKVLDLLVDGGKIHHVGGGVFLADEHYARVREAIVDNCKRNGQLAIPELRDVLGTTRKFLIPLLEHFDTAGVTARRGGTRVLRQA